MELLTDRRLIAFSLCYFMFYLACYCPLNFLPDAMVREHGISNTKAGHVITFLGAGCMLGSISAGLATNHFKNCAVLHSVGCMIVMGCCNIGMAFSDLYWQFVVCSFIYGIAFRYMLVLHPIALVDMFGINSLKVSFGIGMACSCIGSLAGPPIVGWFKVLQGTYQLSFIVAGCCFFLAGIMASIALWKPNTKSSSS